MRTFFLAAVAAIALASPASQAANLLQKVTFLRATYRAGRSF